MDYLTATIYIVVLCFSVHRVAAISCLDCGDGVESLFMCNDIAECLEDQACYVERVLPLDGGNPKYKAGCRNIEFCSIAKCSDDAYKNGTAVKKALADGDMVICSECCYYDNCNIKGCGGSIVEDPSKGIRCFNCPSIKGTDVCLDMVSCASNEICVSEEKYPHTYKLGCQSKRICEVLATATVSNTVCCNTSLCNENPELNRTIDIVDNTHSCPPDLTRPTTVRTPRPTATTARPTTSTTTTPRPTTTTTTTPRPTTSTTTTMRTTTKAPSTTTKPATLTTKPPTTTTARTTTKPPSPTPPPVTTSTTHKVPTKPVTTTTRPTNATTATSVTPNTMPFTTRPSTTTTTQQTTTTTQQTSTAIPTTTTTATTQPTTTTTQSTTTTTQSTTTTTQSTTTTTQPTTTTTQPTSTVKPTTTTQQTTTTTQPTTTTTQPTTTTTTRPTSTQPTTTTTQPTTSTTQPTTTTPQPTTTTTQSTTTTTQPTTTTTQPTTTTTQPTTTTTQPTTTTTQPTTTTTQPTTKTTQTTTQTPVTTTMMTSPAGTTAYMLPDVSTTCLTCPFGADLCEVETFIQPTQCDPPNHYCITHFRNANDGGVIVDRQCGNFDTCYRDWYQGTSDLFQCRSVDQFKTIDYQCTFCCITENCNANRRPDEVTLYQVKHS